MALEYKATKDGVAVSNEFWEVKHSKEHGGAIVSIVFAKGTGKNLLASPLSSHVKFMEPPKKNEMYASYFPYKEINDPKASLDVKRNGKDEIIVRSSGDYSDGKGKSANVKFIRTVTYKKWGFAKNVLEIIAEGKVDKVVEVCALEANFRKGMNKAFVKHHPMLWQVLDFHGCGWMDLPKQNYTARCLPSYVAIIEKNVEGLEIFPGSDYFEWDNLSGYQMQGYHTLGAGEGGQTSLNLNAYCMAFRRVPITLNGRYILELNFGLPFVKNRNEIFCKTLQTGAGSDWPSDKDLKEIADGGVKLVRFHNDYREDGPFWHDGMYPPYDEKGMKELRRVIDTAHKLGMKAVPYMSLKEFHPESPGYLENYRQWQREETLSGEVSHTYFFSGEFGGLMCMKSGWLERRKKDADTILKDLPWDGLYFDWCCYHACHNLAHAVGWHTDVNEFLDFVMWARERIGEKGVLYVHLSSTPSMICENMADLICVGEVSPAALPGEWEIEYGAVPIVQRLCAKWGLVGDALADMALSATLEGFPPGIGVPMNKESRRMFEEYKLFRDEKLDSYRFVAAGEKPVATGQKDVWANLYYSENGALIYTANLSHAPHSGSLQVDLKKWGVKGARLSWVIVDGVEKGEITIGVLSSKGLPYDLKPHTSALYRIKAKK